MRAPHVLIVGEFVAPATQKRDNAPSAATEPGNVSQNSFFAVEKNGQAAPMGSDGFLSI
jgi:hypothetical protein